MVIILLIVGPIGNILEYVCSKTMCNCTEHPFCDEMLLTTLKNLRDAVIFSCDNETSICEMNMKQEGQKLPKSIKTRCKMSGCVNKILQPEYPRIDWIINWYLYIFSALCIILIVIVVIFFSYNTVIAIRYCMRKSEGDDVPMNININIKNYKVERADKSFVTILENVIIKTETKRPIIMLMGPPGAGKTTLIKLIVGVPPIGYVDAFIKLSNYDIKVGYIPQKDINYYNNMTVREVILYNQQLRGLKASKRCNIEELIKKMKAPDILDKKFDILSGGESRKAYLLLQMMVDPDIIIADEPFTGMGLDSMICITLLLNYAYKYNVALIFSMHEPRNVILPRIEKNTPIFCSESICNYYDNLSDYLNYIGYINSGKLVYFQETKQILSDMSADNTLVKVDKTNIFQNINKFCRAEKGFISNCCNVNKNDDEEEFFEKINDNEKKEFVVDINKNKNEKGSIFKSLQLFKFKRKSYSRPTLPTLLQIKVLLMDKLKSYRTNIYQYIIILLIYIIVGLGIGVLYYNLSMNLAGCQNRIGVIFFTLVFLAVSGIDSISTFSEYKNRFTLDTKILRLYNEVTHFLACVIFWLPFKIICILIYELCMYFLVGLNTNFFTFVYFTLMCILFGIISGATCSIIGTLMKWKSGLFVYILDCMMGAVSAGFLSNYKSMNWLMSIIRYYTTWSYAFENLVVQEFSNMIIYYNPDFQTPKWVPGEFLLDLFGMVVSKYNMNVLILLGILCFRFLCLIISIKFIMKIKK